MTRYSDYFRGKSLNLYPDDYTIVDIETTGFDPINIKITEISAVKYRSNRKSCIAIFSRGWYKFI